MIAAIVVLPLWMVVANFSVGNYVNFIVTSASMSPTLRIGDRVVATKVKAGTDLYQKAVVFDLEGEALVKRAVAVSGQQVVINECNMYVDGKPCGKADYGNRSITIPHGRIFVVGDNRAYSYDSLDFGPLEKEKVTHVVKFRYWPLSRMGWVR